MNPGNRMRLYLLGRLDRSGPKQLSIMAEFESSRALEHVVIRRKELDELTQEVLTLRGFVEARYPSDYTERRLTQLGSSLYSMFIRGDIERLFNAASGNSRGLLPLEICAEDQSMAGWPWEYLYDKSRGQFICQEFYPICRGIFTLDNRVLVARESAKLRILVVVGVDSSDPDASPDEQVLWIRNVLSAPLGESDVDLDVFRPKRPQDLQLMIQSARLQGLDVIHFFGHAGFDVRRDEGFINLQPSEGESFRLYARDLAILLAQRGIRLVFLNACETARSGITERPAQTSVAAALLSRGIPAVIGAQFSMPDVSAHYLAGMIYSALMTGQPLINALRDGRQAMGFSKDSRFFDWGIPVLYSFDPDLVLFEPSEKTKRWAQTFAEALKSENVVRSMAEQSSADAPSVLVARTAKYRHKGRPKMRVALVDIDAKVSGLPDLIAAANNAQKYYQMVLAYPPVPSGSFAPGEKANSIYLPRIEQYLASLPDSLQSEYVCCLTGCQIDDGEDSDLLVSTAGDENKVSLLSVFGLRGYANQAGVSFAKAVLFQCLGSFLVMDERWDLDYHEKTANCVLDYCENLGDLVGGLQRMRFDHKKCRDKISDQDQLSAIDKLFALKI